MKRGGDMVKRKVGDIVTIKPYEDRPSLTAKIVRISNPFGFNAKYTLSAENRVVYYLNEKDIIG